VLIATFGGFGLVRGLQRFDISALARVVVGAGFSLVALQVLLGFQYNAAGNPLSLGWLGGFLAHPDGYLTPRWHAVWGVLVVSAAWFRGVWSAQRDFSHTLVFTSFSAGVGIFVLLLVLGQASRSRDAVNLAALPFFACGLAALALIELRRAERVDAGFLRGPWPLVVLGTVGGLAVVSAAVGLFPLDLLYALLAPVGRLALAALDLIILIIALPIAWMLEKVLRALLGRSDFNLNRPQQPASNAAEELRRQSEREPALAFLLIVVKVLLLVALAALVAYVLYRVFRRLRRPERTDDEIHESIAGAGSLGDDLGALFRGLLGRFRRGGDRHEPPLGENALRVRRLYLRMLERGEGKGVARPPAATPHEFAPTLDDAFASRVPDELTERFAAARYGRVDQSQEELARLEREVEGLER
jgi:hypothetical protein